MSRRNNLLEQRPLASLPDGYPLAHAAIEIAKVLIHLAEIREQTASGGRHLQEAIHDVLIEPNGYTNLALDFGFRWHYPASLAFVEIVSIFHRSASYCSRSWASPRPSLLRMR